MHCDLTSKGGSSIEISRCLSHRISKIKILLRFFFLAEAYEMDVYIRYRGNDVLYRHVEAPSGCRVYYGDADSQLIFVQTHTLPSGMYGSDLLCQVGFTLALNRFQNYRCSKLKKKDVAEILLLNNMQCAITSWCPSQITMRLSKFKPSKKDF